MHYQVLSGYEQVGAAYLAGLVVLCVAWLAAATRMRPGGNHSAALAAAMVPVGFAVLVGLVTASSVALPTYALGISRTAAASLVGIGALRFGLLGPQVRVPAVRRASTATVAVAALFIVAQVAQSFLSSTGSVLAGSLMAGLVVLLRNPLQDMGRRRPKAESERAPEGRADGGAAYRNAVRLAMRDRRLSREDEVQLHHLADALHIGAGRAHEILVDVEREQPANTPPS
jgi:hypothetical protein